MAINKIDDYKSLKHRSFPRDRGQRKDQEWAIAYLSSMFHRYYTGYQVEHRYESNYLKELEKYALGTQGAKKVKEKLLRQKQDGSFEGLMKNVFQTFDILPEMIDIMMSSNMKADYRPTAVAIDKVSLKDRDMEIGMAKFLVQKDTKDFLGYMSLKVDSVLTEEELAVYTDSDIDVLFKTGGIQMQREKEAIASCNDAMATSRHKEIENQNTFDLITYGITGTKTYIDYSEDNVKYRHVDVKNLIAPKSKYNDFRDASYFAEVRFMRLHEIISECPSIRHDQIKEIIESRMGYNSDYIGMMGEMEGYSLGQNDVFDEFIVPVLDAQWLASDIEVYLQTPVSNGGYMYKEVKKDYALDKKQQKNNSKLDRKKFIKRYDALWVIGTDILLNFGVAKDNVYYGPEGKRIPKLDYTIVKTGKKSLVDRARTPVDDINLNVAKHRSAIASLPPGPGLIIYEHALQNIKFGGKLQTARDLINGLVEGGVLVVNGRDSKGGYIAANGGKAVEPISPFAIQQIAVFTTEIQNKVNQLRQLLGLPEGLDGTSGNPYTGVGQVQLAAAASSNALFPNLSPIGPLYEITFEKVVPKRQILAKRGKNEVRSAEGNGRFGVLSLSKDFSNYDFAITIRFSPTEEEKMFLLDQINQMAMAFTQSGGTIGCSKAEFFMLYKLIKANLLDEAMHQVARIESLREKSNLQIQQATIQANAQQNNDSIRLNAEAKMEHLQEQYRLERLSGASDAANDTKKDLAKEYLKSYDRENSAIPGQIYDTLVAEANNEVATIEQEAQGNALSQQQQAPPEEMIPQ